MTCTFVMSGTASIGKRVKLHAPSAATRSVASMTRPRRAIAAFRIRSITVALLVVVRGAGLFDIRLDDVTVLGHVACAGIVAAKNLYPFAVLLTELQHSDLICV